MLQTLPLFHFLSKDGCPEWIKVYEKQAVEKETKEAEEEDDFEW